MPVMVGVGEGAAHDDDVRHTGQLDVIDEPRLAGQQLAVLFAKGRRAHAARGVDCHGHQAGTPSAALRIAATMLW